MSLYFDAVSVLTVPSSTGGSFKSRLYNSRSLKASPAQIYALIIEASKWDIILKEVIDQAGILKLEPKLNPLLAVLLVHDHLLAKNGIAAPATHPIRQAVERHKIRLKGEFTKARVRRGCATIPDLKEAVRREKLAVQGAQGAATAAVYPRWVRVNNVRTTLETQLKSTFNSYRKVETLAELADKEEPKMRVDPHIPNLLAVPPGMEITTSPAYKSGEIILQDKASCFPAYLLLGDEPWHGGRDGDLLDGCAAPGNKTTHLASLLAKIRISGSGEAVSSSSSSSRIYSMDASQVRAKTLQKMVSTAGADKFVTVLPGQDFLALDPEDPRFARVAGLLLDPSCSGSGIIGRDDVPKFVLPAAAPGRNNPQGKKRKRGEVDEQQCSSSSSSSSSSSPSTSQKNRNNTSAQTSSSPTDENELTSSTPLDPERLTKLSNLQTRIVEHALGFPAAKRITYSTCSIHMIENESVVYRILTSDVARRRGWRIMRRDEQPAGLREWKHRGIRTEKGENGAEHSVDLSDEVLEACLRCWPGDDEGTGGFFVAGFVRDGDVDIPEDSGEGGDNEKENEEDEDEWEGFSD